MLVSLSRCLKYLILLLFLLPLQAFAHPHVFIDQEIVIEVIGERITGLIFDWRFDAGFSAMVSMDYDRNRDNQFSPAETKALRTGAFDNLAKHSWFTTLILNGVPHKLSSPIDFAVVKEAGRLRYRFRFVLDIPITGAGTELRLGIVDPELYVAFREPVTSQVKLAGDSDAVLTITLSSNKRQPWLATNDYLILMRRVP